MGPTPNIMGASMGMSLPTMMGMLPIPPPLGMPSPFIPSMDMNAGMGSTMQQVDHVGGLGGLGIMGMGGMGGGGDVEGMHAGVDVRPPKRQRVPGPQPPAGPPPVANMDPGALLLGAGMAGGMAGMMGMDAGMINRGMLSSGLAGMVVVCSMMVCLLVFIARVGLTCPTWFGKHDAFPSRSSS